MVNPHERQRWGSMIFQATSAVVDVNAFIHLVEKSPQFDEGIGSTSNYHTGTVIERSLLVIP